MLPEDVQESLNAGRYERTPEGVFFPSNNILAQGVFAYCKRGEPVEYSKNLVVNEGLNYLLGTGVGADTTISTWYIATFTGDVTVLATWTAANFTANSTEWTNYDEANRPTWSRGAVASGGTDSFASKASFTSSAVTQVVRGAALISSSIKSSTSGKLMAASRFASDKTLDTGEILDIGYGLQLTAV
jgi:hypothetical protein